MLEGSDALISSILQDEHGEAAADGRPPAISEALWARLVELGAIVERQGNVWRGDGGLAASMTTRPAAWPVCMETAHGCLRSPCSVS